MPVGERVFGQNIRDTIRVFKDFKEWRKWEKIKSGIEQSLFPWITERLLYEFGLTLKGDDDSLTIFHTDDIGSKNIVARVDITHYTAGPKSASLFFPEAFGNLDQERRALTVAFASGVAINRGEFIASTKYERIGPGVWGDTGMFLIEVKGESPSIMGTLHKIRDRLTQPK